MSFEFSPISRRDIGRLVAMELGQPGFMAVVAPAETDAAARIATRLGQSAARLEASDDVRALSERLHEMTADPMIVSGLDRLSDWAWQQLDRWRSRITSDRLTLLVLSPESAARFLRHAPNLASLFTAFFRWEDTPDGSPEPAAGDADQAEFDRLAHRWMEETHVFSSLTRIVQHPAYQQIVAMGERAIRPILRELEREPRMWGPALHAITGARPVPEADAGKVARVAKAWLSWAKDNGYAW